MHAHIGTGSFQAITQWQNVLYGVVYYLCCHSFMSDSLQPQTGARQAPLSRGFSRQEYWSGLPFPPPGDLPNPEIEPVSPALAGGFFYH